MTEVEVLRTGRGIARPGDGEGWVRCNCGAILYFSLPEDYSPAFCTCPVCGGRVYFGGSDAAGSKCAWWPLMGGVAE